MPHPTRLHPAARAYAAEVAAGTMDRREFLTRATALGVSAGAAYGLIGAAKPAHAAAHMQDGGTLRIESTVIALKDPRSYDWPQMSNFTRGWLEYLVQYERDGTFTPMLLDSWEVNEDATEYRLNVRPGVTWNDGSPFTSQDVAFNIARWCDRNIEGNSMASRFPSLIDDGTGQAREDAIVAGDDGTVTLSLSAPDITLIASFSDFPAAIVPQDFTGDPLENPKGTGPYLPETFEVGIRAAMVRNDDHTWWGKGVVGESALERIEYLDYGTDPAVIVSAVESEEVDMVYESLGDYIDIFDSIGWDRTETVTSGTVVIRPNQQAQVNGTAPFADVRVRKAIQMAVSNETCLTLGYNDRGEVAANHHVCPIHPEYADIGPSEYDPEGALALLTEAGMADFEFDLVSIDDDWRRNTADAVAAQMRDAGMNVSRTIMPGATFWNDWVGYPFSTTDWGHRPLGVQVLSLAYRSGEPWNEAGFENADFDAALNEALSIADADARREVMTRVETILREEGVIVQPFWRSIYRHVKPGVTGAEMHPAFEINPAQLGWSA